MGGMQPHEDPARRETGKRPSDFTIFPPSAPVPNLSWAELSWKLEPKEFTGSYTPTPGPGARLRGWTWRGQEARHSLKSGRGRRGRLCPGA